MAVLRVFRSMPGYLERGRPDSGNIADSNTSKVSLSDYFCRIGPTSGTLGDPQGTLGDPPPQLAGRSIFFWRELRCIVFDSKNKIGGGRPFATIWRPISSKSPLMISLYRIFANFEGLKMAGFLSFTGIPFFEPENYVYSAGFQFCTNSFRPL